MQVTRTSIQSNITRTLELDITEEQLRQIEARENHIQNVVPHLTADEREFLLTGIVQSEWDELFPEDEEGIEDIEDEDVEAF